MQKIEKIPIDQLMLIGYVLTSALLLLLGAAAWGSVGSAAALIICTAIVALLFFLAHLRLRIKKQFHRHAAVESALLEMRQPLLKAVRIHARTARRRQPELGVIALDR